MTSDEPQELLEIAQSAAEVGSRIALRWQGRAAELLIEEKAASDDLVSQADRETEVAICEVLREHRPDDAILGEETGEEHGHSRVRWVVDPIDGTTNYLYGRPDWAVSVAAIDGTGRVLAGVVAEPALSIVTTARIGAGTKSSGTIQGPLTQTDLSRALIELNAGRPAQRALFASAVAALVGSVRDVRRGGSAAVALAQVATGRADAAWLPGLQPWDCAAGILLVHEAGGCIGDLDGVTAGWLPPSGDVLAAPPGLWELLLGRLRPVYQATPPGAEQVVTANGAEAVRPRSEGGLPRSKQVQ